MAHGQGGVNDSTSTEGTGIASLSYADVVRENTEFQISVTLDEGNIAGLRKRLS